MNECAGERVKEKMKKMNRDNLYPLGLGSIPREPLGNGPALPQFGLYLQAGILQPWQP